MQTCKRAAHLASPDSRSTLLPHVPWGCLAFYYYFTVPASDPELYCTHFMKSVDNLLALLPFEWLQVAILIPFRNRHEHLPIFFRHLIPMLQRQHLEFSFYVIEQAGTQTFNRAMLFNVGFKEAMKDRKWDCVIFHDVDHIPENDRNYYGCGEMPRHFATKLDKYMYILPYNEFFGGVSGLTVEQFRKINGFPNAFWGWGGEDDDLWNRVHYAGFNVSRPEGDLGKYKSIPHHHRGEVQFLGRYKLLRYSKERQFLDGLNNLIYAPNIVIDRLYKNITVNLVPELAPVKDY
ncbi:unnamed protein product [Ranitomeya imitator]|uniref:Beta-1,4-galactosyltransferase 6 n=1 Tax=Ranitomeya imitator TaxID=111125 RepID=A0ABN9M3I2_9NEOB|nr:unnamed protein product [Ranitomeya imitator]